MTACGHFPGISLLDKEHMILLQGWDQALCVSIPLCRYFVKAPNDDVQSLVSVHVLLKVPE